MEIWKEIAGINGGYISNKGRAKSVTSRGEKILTPQLYKRKNKNLKDKNRVYFDRRSTQGKAFYVFIHNAVADAFLTTGKGNVLFKDGNTLNCEAENLVRMYDSETEDCGYIVDNLKECDNPINNAAIQFIRGNKDDIYMELIKYFDDFTRKISYSYRIDDAACADCFYSAMEKFILRIKSGILDAKKNAVGLFWSMVKFEAIKVVVNNGKLVEWSDNAGYSAA